MQVRYDTDGSPDPLGYSSAIHCGRQKPVKEIRKSVQKGCLHQEKEVGEKDSVSDELGLRRGE